MSNTFVLQKQFVFCFERGDPGIPGSSSVFLSGIVIKMHERIQLKQFECSKMYSKDDETELNLYWSTLDGH